MKKNIYITTIILAFLTLASCRNNDKPMANENVEPIPVKVNKVSSNSNQSFLTASGKIEAVNSANLSTRMMGFVNKILVKVGDKVNKGQLLISINNSELQAKRAQVEASITQAKAAFNNAQKDYVRFKNLFAENSASQKELDDITAHFEIAKANLEAAEQMKNEVNAQFAYVNISAPFSGIITNIFIDEGDMANPGMTLISMEAPDYFEVTSVVPESDISKIKSGIEVDVHVKSIGKSIKGKVTEVSSSAANTGGQYLVKVNLGKTSKDIFSGMYVTVKFPIEKSINTNNTVLIPKDALITYGQLSGVYTVGQNSTAVLRWLRLGNSFGDQVEVLSGLSFDESYIISSKGKLFNGVKVSIQ